MWLLKYYLLAMLVTLLPVLSITWFMFSRRGNKMFWMVLGIAFLGFLISPFLMSDGHFEGVFSTIVKVVCLYVFWVLLTLAGLVVWGIFFVFLEVARGVLGGFGLSLPSPFMFVGDRVAKLFDFIDNGFYDNYKHK